MLIVKAHRGITRIAEGAYKSSTLCRQDIFVYVRICCILYNHTDDDRKQETSLCTLDNASMIHGIPREYRQFMTYYDTSNRISLLHYCILFTVWYVPGKISICTKTGIFIYIHADALLFCWQNNRLQYLFHVYWIEVSSLIRIIF